MYWSGHKGLKNLIYLVLIVVPLFSFGLTNHGLWSADEPRVAEIGREMALTGNWAVPMLNQRPFLEEPPLYYGALALTFKALGVSDRVARIPSAIFAFATVLVLFFTVNFLFGPRIALFSGIILATTGEYFRVAHTVIVDSALTFFIACAMSLFIVGYLSDSNRKKLLCYILLYISCTFAFYTKGFIGIVIPGLGILTFLVADKNIKEIIKMRLWLGILIFLVLTLPWFITLWQQGGKEHLDVFLCTITSRDSYRGSSPEPFQEKPSRRPSPFFYIPIEFRWLLPWSLLLVPVFHPCLFEIRQIRKHHPRKGRLLAKCWFFAGIVFLSAASTKRTLYLMPIFCPMALLTSLYVESTLYRLTDKIEKAFLWAFTAIFAIIGISAVPVYSSIQGIYPWIRGTNCFLRLCCFRCSLSHPLF